MFFKIPHYWEVFTFFHYICLSTHPLLTSPSHFFLNDSNFLLLTSNEYHFCSSGEVPKAPSTETCVWSCWKEAEFGSIISSFIGEDETMGYFISFEISLCVLGYPNPWKPKWCFSKGFYTSVLSFLPILYKDLRSVASIMPQRVSAGSCGMTCRSRDSSLLSAADRN